jgi:hypothetical protein
LRASERSKSRRSGQAALEQRIKEICHRAFATTIAAFTSFSNARAGRNKPQGQVLVLDKCNNCARSPILNGIEIDGEIAL